MKKRGTTGVDSEAYKNHIPLYHQIVSAIKQQIMDGELKNGDKIPTEKWLSEHFEVSRVTVRKALKDLMEQGFVEKRPNKGSFVIQPKYDKELSRMRSMHQELLAAGVLPSSKIISYQIIEADQWCTEYLGCKEGNQVIVIERIRYADDRPFAHQILYLPQKMFPEFNPWKLVDHSLHDIMQDEYKIDISHSTQSITAKLLTKEETKELKIRSNNPILHIKSTVYTKDNEVCEYADTHFITDVVRYSFTWYK